MTQEIHESKWITIRVIRILTRKPDKILAVVDVGPKMHQMWRILWIPKWNIGPKQFQNRHLSTVNIQVNEEFARLHELKEVEAMSGEWVHIEVEQITQETEKAFCVVVDGQSHWLPKSQIADADQYAEGDVNFTLSITEWLAIEKGLEEE